MNTFPVTIADIYTSMTRPLVKKILEDIKRMTSMDLTTEIMYVGGSPRPIQLGSEITNSDTQLQQGTNATPHRNLLRLDIAEEPVTGQVLASAVIRNNEQFIFHDPDLDIALRPNYMETEITFTITNRFNSKVAAERWRDGIRARTSMGRMNVPHVIQYHYDIPVETLFLLNALHYYRENVAGYGEDLRAWLTKCLSKRATVLVNQGGEHHTLVMSEEQGNLVGWFDFEVKPTPGSKNNANGTWEISFDYKVRYFKPEAVVMSYPMMIHNQLLPEDISDRSVPYQLQQSASRFSTLENAYNHLEAIRLTNPGSGIAGISIPYYDNWFPEKKPIGTSPLMRIMLAVDPDDLQSIMDLKDIGEYSIDPDILEYMKADYGRLALTLGAGIRVNLYRKRIPMGDQFLTIDPDLVVRASEPLSLREGYHLAVSITTDLMAIPDAAKTILCNHGTACLKIMLSLAPELPKTKHMPRLNSGGKISRQEYINAAAYINERFTRDYPTKQGGWVRVTNIVIATQGVEHASNQ